MCNQLAEQAPAAAGQGEAQGAVAQVEPQIAITAGTQDGYAAGGCRAHASPFDGGLIVARIRESAAGQLTHLRQALGVRGRVEADDIDHRGDAQLLADTRVDNFAVVVGNAHLWCLLRVGQGQRKAVTLERVQRQVQPRQAQGRAVVPGGEHQLVHGQNLVAHFHCLYRPVGVAKPGDGLAQHKGATATGLQAGGQLLTEPVAIPDLFAGGINTADECRALQPGFQAGALAGSQCLLK